MKRKRYKNYCPVFFSTAAVLFSLLTPFISAAQEENEETYSIDLVQTAEVTKETVELDNKKILTETYTATEGDHIWKILRNRDLLKRNKLGEVLSTLKKLNPALSNIDMIHPGQKIVIPLVITPITDREPARDISDIETVPLSDLENLEYYTVTQGDSLIKVINSKYTIPEEELYNEYLDKLRKLNPDLKDLNQIMPGQKLRLPIYSPKVARGNIVEKSKKQEPEPAPRAPEAREIGNHLEKIFTLIGEEWISQGKHYIPLKTGGKIDLNTGTYPIMNLKDGTKIVVDLFGSLPDEMAGLITSNWDNYKIIHITAKDDLKSAVSRILSACAYNRVYTSDESLVFEDSIKIELSADWIIKLRPDSAGVKDNIICLTLTDGQSGKVPSTIKRFLAGHGIRIIEYPEGPGGDDNISDVSVAVDLENNRKSVTEKLLELAGQDYSARADIPIYQGEDSNFNLTIKADYFFSRNGKECVIDLSGLGEDILKLLRERGFLVLPISGDPATYDHMAKTLDFLGISFENKKHTFYAVSGNKRENIKIIIPGILFKDSGGKSDLFTSVNLPVDISGFLATRVDNIFFLNYPAKAE